MNKSLKIFPGVLLTAFFVGNMAACGEADVNMKIMNNPDLQPEYLSFFATNNFDGSDVEKYWSDQFTQRYNQNVYIEYDAAEYYAEEGLSYRELLIKRMESSMPDDMYIINAEDVIEFERKGYWQDLSGMDFVNNLSEAALYQSTYEGKVFSVPLCFTGFGFYWNVDLLTEHGLNIPQNYEQFLAVCESLKEAGILPYGANKGYALTVPAMCRGMAPLYQDSHREERIQALNSGEAAISMYVKDGYELLDLMIKKGYLDPEQAMNTVPEEERKLFLEGGCAFICDKLSTDVTENSSFQVEATGLPVLDDGFMSVYGADARLAVNPNSEHLDIVYRFIEMVGTSEALNTSAKMKNVISSAKDGINEDMQGKEQIVELLQQPSQIPNQDFSLHFNTWENIRDMGREICQRTSVEEACRRLDELQKEELEEYEKKR